MVRTVVRLRPGEPLQVVEVRGDQPWIAVSPLDGVRFQVTVTAPPEIGRYKGALHLRLTLPLATEVEIPVTLGVVLRR